MGVIDDARRAKDQADAAVPKITERLPGIHASVQPGRVYAYKAISDEANGEIQVKQVNSDGSVTGDAKTLKVLP